MAFTERLLESGFIMHHSTGYSEVYELSITYIANQGAAQETTSSSPYHFSSSAVMHSFLLFPSVVAAHTIHAVDAVSAVGVLVPSTGRGTKEWHVQALVIPVALMLDRRGTDVGSA